MRLAILSDIHGNPIALDAVLQDIAAQGGVDRYWVLGDFAALGYDPVTVLERLRTLPDAHFIRGNTDRYLVTGERPGPSLQQAQDNPEHIARLLTIHDNFAWTHGYISASGWFDWLKQLPLDIRLTLPNGKRLLGVHAAPGTDDGMGIHPGLSDETLRAMLTDAEADILCVGHTHFPMERVLDNGHVINLGSVSNPVTPSLRATYILLDADENGYHIQPRQVDYDHQAVIEAIRRVHHPAGEMLIRYMQGQMLAQWA